jgi:dTDP-4-amino-4,6-dideoxygalactose transaminase
MRIRQQLTVASPLSASDIAGAVLDTITRRDHGDAVRAVLAREFRASDVLLTDSGTSALVLALRMFAKPGQVVAMPAYACVDLIAAARRADVRVKLFDIDPHTLSPDMDSVRRVLTDGVSALVVAHLYGFPADMPAVMQAARSAGVPVIEDAAQHAGATVAGQPAGSFGDVTVLSFGRGKGTTSGRGGALLFRGGTSLSQLDPVHGRAGSAGDIAVAAASWTLGRPSIYGIPASIPSLHLGETVYHEAGEPLGMSLGATAILQRTLPRVRDALLKRRVNAAALRDAADDSRNVDAVRVVATGESGYLRFPILVSDGVHDDTIIGIARAYPRPLAEEPEIRSIFVQSSEQFPGAGELACRLMTLPTHHMLTQTDTTELNAWLRNR